MGDEGGGGGGGGEGEEDGDDERCWIGHNTCKEKKQSSNRKGQVE